MRGLLRFIGSRKFAVYVLFAFFVILSVSAMLPSEMTLSAQEWYRLQNEQPALYWVSERFSTPRLVGHPVFIVVSVFLFFSTLVCTITRISRRMRIRRAEFEKERAFSFSLEGLLPEGPAVVKESLRAMLVRKRWECSTSGGEGSFLIEAQKGLGLGFWGSVVFHAGIIVCFMAAPLTAFTVSRGELVLTEGVALPFEKAYSSYDGGKPVMLSGSQVEVHDLWGEYYEGIHKVDFGGVLNIDGTDYRFKVNEPVIHRGYQMSLHEYGYSPNVIVRKEGGAVFDYFLNLRHAFDGDYFDLGAEGLRIFVLFFPDFERKGSLLSTKSQTPENPVLLVKFMKEGAALHKGLLLRPGEEAVFGEYTVAFEGFRNWISMNVVKEWGLPLVSAGFVIGIPGLFVRFLSNERRLEFEVSGSGTGSRVSIRGFSRYYPAFLEREITGMAEGMNFSGTEVKED